MNVSSFTHGSRPTNLNPGREPLLPELAPGWSAASHAFYRRQRAKRPIQIVGEALKRCTEDEIDLQMPHIDTIPDRQTLPTEQVFSGIYTPHPDVALPGHLKHEDGTVSIVPPEAVEFFHGSDVTASEMPTPEQVVHVNPELLASAQAYCFLRRRDEGTLQALKRHVASRLKHFDNSEVWKLHQLAMVTALGFEPSAPELMACSHLTCQRSATKAAYVTSVLDGESTDLLKHRTAKPALVTRVLDFIYPNRDPMVAIPRPKATR
jgi:hypothetical protein